MKTCLSVFSSQNGRSWRQVTTRNDRVDPQIAPMVLQGVDPKDCGFVFHAESRSGLVQRGRLNLLARLPRKDGKPAPHLSAFQPVCSTHQLITALLIASASPFKSS